MKTLKVAITAVVVIAAMSWASQSDYEDAVVTEMKNNGAYWELSEQHPEATDVQLIKMYKNAEK